MKKFIISVIGIVALICICKECYSRYIGIEKVAINERQIKKEEYIICMEAVTTGFEWTMMRDEDGNTYKETEKFVALEGVDEVPSLLGYGAGVNSYVFYITDKRVAKDEIRGTHYVYTVDDWDILYPVKRDRIRNIISSIFESRRYVTYNDLPPSLKEKRIEQRNSN